jgi:hypothetical protein
LGMPGAERYAHGRQGVRTSCAATSSSPNSYCAVA